MLDDRARRVSDSMQQAEQARRAAEEGDTGRLDPVVDDLADDRAGDPAGPYGVHGGVEGLVPEPRRGRRRKIDPDATQIGLESGPDRAFDPGDTGTWRVSYINLINYK